MENLITLWTIKKMSAWEDLQKTRILQRTSASPSNDYPEPYAWMMEQMNLRIPGYTGSFPIWAWYSPKPDLRYWAWADPVGEQGVRIEFQVPKSDILLSNFDAWHAVLGNHYLSLTKEEEDKHEDCTEAETRKSWKRIFNLELIASSLYWCPQGIQDIQAVVEKITLDQVVRVTPFKGRGTKIQS